MNDRTRCPNTKKDFSDDGADNVDAYVVLGDLNFRLPAMAANQVIGATTDIKIPKEKILDAVVEKSSTPSGRLELGEFDPLSAMSRAPAWLVQSEEENGLGFVCNRPFEFYMPTYKFQRPAECSDMARRVAEWTPNIGVVDAHMNRKRIRSCYEDKGELPVKDVRLQMGWLDRVCARTTHGSSVKAAMVADEGWTVSDGNDHMAVSVTVQVTTNPRPGCCPVTGLPEHSSLKKLGGELGTVVNPGYILETEYGRLSCGFPRSLFPKESMELSLSEEMEKVLTVNCNEDGTLTVGGRPLSDFECRRPLTGAQSLQNAFT